MKLLSSLLNIIFHPRNGNLSDEEDFSLDEIRQISLKAMLSQLERCLKYPFIMKEKYETLKANLREVIESPQVTSRQFKDYICLLYPEMDRKGDWHEGIDYLKLAVAVRQSEEDILESYIWFSLFHSYIADYKAAIDIAQKGIELAQKLKDNSSLMRAMSDVARGYRSLGNYEKPIAYYNGIIEIARRENDEEEEAHSYGSMGLTYWHLNEYEKSLAALQTAQDKFIELTNEERTGHTFNNMGLVYTDLGLYNEALNSFERAAVFARNSGDKKEFALTEGNIGMAYFFINQPNKALSYLKRTMRTMEELQSYYRLAKAKIQIARVYQNMPQNADMLEVALQYAKESYEIGLRYRIIHFEIMAAYQAIILKDLNQIDEAVSISKKAVEILDQVKVFDGLEEEIYFNHYLILKEKDAVEAIFYLMKSNKEMEMKLEKITNSNYRESFLNTELHKRILAEVAKNTN